MRYFDKKNRNPPLALCANGGGICIRPLEGSKSLRACETNGQKTQVSSDQTPANTEETVVVAPCTAEPTDVELTPPAVIVPQCRDDQIQAEFGDRAETDDRIFPLFLGIDFPESEDVADLARVVAVFLHQPNGLFGRDAPIEVEELPLPLAELVGGNGKIPLHLRQVTVVVAELNVLLKSEVGVDGHELTGFNRSRGTIYLLAVDELDFRTARLDVAGRTSELVTMIDDPHQLTETDTRFEHTTEKFEHTFA